ncbi:MAG TPA: divalent metal cation transporter [Thermoanaerobaculia bacterium]|nr:divalent metal cation transporter [Thermoanaerobaculia bacterium]
MTRIRAILSRLGPGLVAGASADDPSAIAAFSIAGAQAGHGFLWFAWLSWPFMAAVQMMSARVGMVAGRGLIGALRAKLPRPVLLLAAAALFVANTVNIGADLLGMAAAASLVTGLRPWLFVVMFGGFIAFMVVKLPYRKLASAFRWFALFLAAYAVAAVRLAPGWRAVAREMFTITLPSGATEWQILLALTGATFSPYFFIWQASQEVEETRDMRAGGQHLAGTRWEDLRFRRIDVGVGTFLSRAVLFFVVLTTSLTLHRRAVMPATVGEAAEALRPAGGAAATWLFALGLIGVGFLVVPVLCASAAYAFADAFGWRHGLDEGIGSARGFYAVLLLSAVAGIAMQWTNITPFEALFWSGVVNGLLAPFLLAGVLLVATDRKMMKEKVSPPVESIAVGATIVAILAAGAIRFV